MTPFGTAGGMTPFGTAEATWQYIQAAELYKANPLATGEPCLDMSGEATVAGRTSVILRTRAGHDLGVYSVEDRTLMVGPACEEYLEVGTKTRCGTHEGTPDRMAHPGSPSDARGTGASGSWQVIVCTLRI